MSFVLYDLIFLAVFLLIGIIFFYKRKSHFKRQGLLYLYHTRIGLKIIESTNKRFAKILYPMQYVVIASGYILMAIIVWMILRFSWVYLSSPTLAEQIRIPVLMPLIPYLPDLFNVDFLPKFYFTYWILIIAILAIPHEFFHGIFARLNKIKVHSTGFGFLGPFLAAFVEPDEKQMEKKSKFAQLSVLASGTFANVILTVLFAILLWIFFASAFSTQGVYFDSYASSVLDVSSIETVNGIPINSISDIAPMLNGSTLTIVANNQTFYTLPEVVQHSITNNLSAIGAFMDSPAYQAQLQGIIKEVNGEQIGSYQELVEIISSSSPGEEISIISLVNGEERTYNITLVERNGKAFLGIAKADLSSVSGRGLISSVSAGFYRVLDPIKYNQYFNGVAFSSDLGDFGIFIYNFLWWTVLINISVALVNMLPLGIFDGGRFFYLTIWGITGSKKIGEQAFKWSTWVLLIIVALLMAKWFIAVI